MQGCDRYFPGVVAAGPIAGIPGWRTAQGFTSFPLGEEWKGYYMAVSSRGLGRGPLKAVTRVRIPLPLLNTPHLGLIVYRLGRHPFKVQRRVRLPLGL